MAKKDCSPGLKYDSLVKRCTPIKTKSAPKPAAPRPTGPPLRPVVQLRATSPAPVASSVIVLSPALWISVVLVTVVSILVVVLWVIIYRKHSRTSRTLDVDQQQDPLQKAEPPLVPVYNNHAAAMGPSPWTHLHPGAQTGSEWEETFTAHRDPPEHAGTEEEGGLPLCCTLREHRVPLPATELGGTLLVTTKTV